MISMSERLEKEENELLFISRRLYVLEAFTQELERVTRAKRFRIWHGTLWMVILDSRDMHVIHFGAWLKSLYSPGGFFGTLQAHNVRDLPRKWPPLSQDHSLYPISNVLEGHHNDAFASLFPEARGSFPQPDDIEALKDRFEARVSCVVDDRNKNRAHPYEKSGSGSGSAKMLNVKELREITDFVENVFNQIRLVSMSSTFRYADMNPVPSDVVAEELVDSVLIGPARKAAVVKRDRERNEFYMELHQRHDALGGGGEQPFFNDNSFLFPLPE